VVTGIVVVVAADARVPGIKYALRKDRTLTTMTHLGDARAVAKRA